MGTDRKGRATPREPETEANGTVICARDRRDKALPDSRQRDTIRRSARPLELPAALEAAGLRTYPSVACFVLVDMGSEGRAADAAEFLMRRGIVPRTFPQGHPAAQCLRLTVRAPEENDRLIAAITAFTGGTA